MSLTYKEEAQFSKKRVQEEERSPPYGLKALIKILDSSLRGTIHKGRPQKFRDFGPPPPLSAFWLDL